MAINFDKVIFKAMKDEGYSPEDAEGVTRRQVLEHMTPGEIALLSSLPQKMQDRIFQVLGVGD